MRINFFKFLIGAPIFLAVAPAYACVGEVPTFSVQDLSGFIFLAASVLSLLALGYMSLPKAIKLIIRKGMAITAMGLAGLVAVGIVAVAVQTQMARSPQPHNTIVPTTVHVAPMLPQRF